MKTTLVLTFTALYAATVAAAALAAPPKHARIDLRKTPLGRVLVDSRGFTLYLYTPDRTKRSVCYGGCASAWPPLLTRARPLAGKGVRSKLLGTTRRKDGKLQVTYAGHPLYFYVGDRKAGQTTGQDVGGIWYVLSPAGAKVVRDASAQTATTPAQTTPTQTTTTPGDGYGGGY